MTGHTEGTLPQGTRPYNPKGVLRVATLKVPSGSISSGLWRGDYLDAFILYISLLFKKASNLYREYPEHFKNGLPTDHRQTDHARY